MKTTKLSIRFALSLVSLLALSVRAADNMPASAPVAKIGSTVLTEDELRKEMGMSLYEVENQLYMVKKSWVDQKAKTLLMTQAAKEAKMSLADWQRKEIDSKLSAPSQQEIDQMATRFQKPGSSPTDAEYKEMKEKARQAITQQKRAAKENEVYQQLTQKWPVDLLFTKPVQPRIDITYAADDPVKGPKSAPITIIEFTDFQCPYCKRSQDTLKQVMDTYKDKVKLIEKQYPLPFHNRAKPAAEAALCAKEQGKFWEMHDKLFASANLEDADIKRMADEVGLNTKKFTSCYESHRMAARVDKDVADAQRFGVRGTPHFFVNGRVINGAQPFEAFQSIIDEELAKKN